MNRELRVKNKILVGVFFAALLSLVIISFMSGIARASTTPTVFSIPAFSGGNSYSTTTAGYGPYPYCFLTTVGTGDSNGGNPNSGGVCLITNNNNGTFSLTADGYGSNSGITNCSMRCFSASSFEDVSAQVSGGSGQRTLSTVGGSYEFCLLTN